MTVTATPARHSTPRPVSSRPAASTPRVDGPAVRRRVLPALLAAHSWWVELLVAVGFYLGYEATRGVAAGKAVIAMANGRALDHLERLTHLAVEPGLAQALNARHLLAVAAGYYYGIAHFLVTVAVLVWLYVRHRSAYPCLRTTLLVTNLVALAVFWAVPVAPPRMVLPHAVDTMTSLNVLGAAHPHSLFDLANPYAAMPSLHAAWAVWCALAVAAATGRRLVRLLAWLYPLATALVVMATANHYLLDVLAGLVLTLTAQQAVRALMTTRPGHVHHLAAAPSGLWSAAGGPTFGSLAQQPATALRTRQHSRIVRPSRGAGSVTAAATREQVAAARLPQLSPPGTGRARLPLRRVVRVLLGLGAAAGLGTVLAAQRSVLTGSVGVLQDLRWRWVPVVLAAELVSMEAVARTHRRLLGVAGAAVRPASVRAIVYASTAISVSLPLAGSQVAAGYSLRELVRRGADASAAAWVLVASGVAATTAFALLVAAGTAATATTTAAVVGIGAALTAVVPALLLPALRRPGVRSRVESVTAGLLARYRRLARRPVVSAAQTVQVVQDFAGRLLTYRAPRRQQAVVLALALANWVADCLCLTAAIAAVGAHVPWQGLLLAFVGAAGVNSLGVTPGGLGVVEATLTAGLVAAGLDARHALAATLLYRLVNFWLVMAAGWVVFSISHGSAHLPHGHSSRFQLETAMQDQMPMGTGASGGLSRAAAAGSHASKPFPDLVKRFVLAPKQGGQRTPQLGTAPELANATRKYSMKQSESGSPEQQRSDASSELIGLAP